MKKNKGLFMLCFTSLMAAIIAIFTAFVKINTGIGSGYIHLGDCIVYLSGCLLGPYGLLSSCIGGAIADVLAGAPVYAAATAIIKALTCLPFALINASFKKKGSPMKIISKYTVPMTVVGALVTVGGYFAAECIMFDTAYAVSSVLFNVVQGVGSGVVFILLGLALDKAKITKYFN